MTCLPRRHRRFQLDIDKMITELREEGAQIERVILSLKRLARGRTRRRGRPPSWLKEVTNSQVNSSKPQDRLHLMQAAERQGSRSDGKEGSSDPNAVDSQVTEDN